MIACSSSTVMFSRLSSSRREPEYVMSSRMLHRDEPMYASTSVLAMVPMTSRPIVMPDWYSSLNVRSGAR